MESSPTATALINPEATGRLVLVRHGSTEWSRSGQHTGRTDLPLLPEGENDAYAVGQALADRSFGLVLSSPLQRAWRTAELAGLQPHSEPNLVEWDYGGYEGLTSAAIREQTGDGGWTIFTHGVIPGESAGETLDQVADRARAVLHRVAPTLRDEDVCVVAHGHTLRVLACVYLGLPSADGGQFLLDAGSISVLEMEKATPAIRTWNHRPGRTAYDPF